MFNTVTREEKGKFHRGNHRSGYQKRDWELFENLRLLDDISNRKMPLVRVKAPYLCAVSGL